MATDSAFATYPRYRPDPPPLPESRITRYLIAAWAAFVVASEAKHGILVVLWVPLVAAWLAAIVLSVIVVRRAARPLRARMVRILVLAILLSAYCTNWSIFAPETYFASHRGGFNAIAQLARSDSLGGAHNFEDFGGMLPLELQSLSDTRSAGWLPSTADGDKGNPVFFIPEWVSLLGNAGGYVYVIGVPKPGLLIETYGGALSLTNATDLGGGWWWTG